MESSRFLVNSLAMSYQFLSSRTLTFPLLITYLPLKSVGWYSTTNTFFKYRVVTGIASKDEVILELYNNIK